MEDQPTQPASKLNDSDVKTIVTVVLLTSVFPIGLIVMWAWSDWSKKVKTIITAIGCSLMIIPLVILLGIMGIIVIGNSIGHRTLTPDTDNSMQQQYNRQSYSCLEECADFNGQSRITCMQACQNALGE